MKVVMKKVYYCDYCKKHGLRSLKTHELHCTANPNRECRLCGRKSVKEIIEKYKACFKLGTESVDTGVAEKYEDVKVIFLKDFTKVIFLKDFTLEDIRNDVQNEDDIPCPTCLLTVIRNLGLNRYYFERKFEFDYKAELESLWKERNAELNEKGF